MTYEICSEELLFTEQKNYDSDIFSSRLVLVMWKILFCCGYYNIVSVFWCSSVILDLQNNNSMRNNI